MVFEMTLNPVPFAKMKDGSKTIEIRCNDEKRSRLKVGDTILFSLPDKSDSLLVRVVQLYRFETFRELYSAFDLSEFGCEDMMPQQLLAATAQVYSEEKQRAYGALGIRIELLARRKPTRLQAFDYSTVGAYFITICTKGRKSVLGRVVKQKANNEMDEFYSCELSEYGKLADVCIKNIPVIYSKLVSVEKYVIMPNHIHLLLMINPDESGRTVFAPTVSRVVKQLKGAVSKKPVKLFGKGRSLTTLSATKQIMMKPGITLRKTR